VKTIRFPRRAVLLGGLAAFLSGCASKFRSYDGPEVTRVRLYKGQRLLVLDGVDRVLQTYPVGLGFAPEGHKQFEGDGRTPEGAYVVDKRNPESTYHLSVGISYPNEADIAFAEAQGLSPGGDIFIHGGPRPRLDSWLHRSHRSADRGHLCNGEGRNTYPDLCMTVFLMRR
jgi:hypothetical protein